MGRPRSSSPPTSTAVTPTSSTSSPGSWRADAAPDDLSSSSTATRSRSRRSTRAARRHAARRGAAGREPRRPPAAPVVLPHHGRVLDRDRRRLAARLRVDVGHRRAGHRRRREPPRHPHRGGHRRGARCCAPTGSTSTRCGSRSTATSCTTTARASVRRSPATSTSRAAGACAPRPTARSCPSWVPVARPGRALAALPASPTAATARTWPGTRTTGNGSPTRCSAGSSRTTSSTGGSRTGAPRPGVDGGSARDRAAAGHPERGRAAALEPRAPPRLGRSTTSRSATTTAPTTPPTIVRELRRLRPATSASTSFHDRQIVRTAMLDALRDRHPVEWAGVADTDEFFWSPGGDMRRPARRRRRTDAMAVNFDMKLFLPTALDHPGLPVFMSREHRSASSDSPLHTSYSSARPSTGRAGSAPSPEEHWDPAVPHPVVRIDAVTGVSPDTAVHHYMVQDEEQFVQKVTRLISWAQEPDGRLAKRRWKARPRAANGPPDAGPRRSRSSGGRCTSRAVRKRCARTTGTCTR